MGLENLIEDFMHRLKDGSSFFLKTKMLHVSSLDVEDIDTMNQIGQGCFNDIFTIRRRQQLEALEGKDEYCEYVAKIMRSDLNKTERKEATMDITLEAVWLSHLNHPNVVKLHATIGDPGKPSFALVLEKLGCTLDHEIYNRWAQEYKQAKGGLLRKKG